MTILLKGVSADYDQPETASFKVSYDFSYSKVVFMSLVSCISSLWLSFLVI